MARKVFFSFYYKDDVRRVVQVRNSWVVRAKGEAQPFLDKAEWESLQRSNPNAVNDWIEDQLDGASVTVVLFGSKTFERDWVKHEIKRSHELRKGILAIDIHKVKDPVLGISSPGRNPLSHWRVTRNGQPIQFTQLYKTYDWVDNDGYNNLSTWIEAAAKAAGR